MAGGNAEAARRLSLKAAAELAGLTVRAFRRHVKEGRVNVMQDDSGTETVTLSALVEAGLVPDDLSAASRGNQAASRGNQAPSRGNQAPSRGKEAASRGRARTTRAPAVVDGAVGTWVAASETQELMRRLLAEREMLGAEWKERTETLYREIIDDQRDRLKRLEKENRDLTQQLQDALRRIPKLLELESVEAEGKQLAAELEKTRSRLDESLGERRSLGQKVAMLEADQAEGERRRKQLAESLERMRSRGLLDRLLDREPRARLEH